MIFNYSARKNNKNVFAENVKKLSQHITVSGSIIHYAPTVSYAVSILTAPEFEAPVNPEKNYECGYVELELRELLDKANEFDKKILGQIITK